MRTTALLGGLALMASGALAQNAERGADAFNKACKTCHQVGENARNRAGPQLNDLIGRQAGQADGFRYSRVFQSSDVVWNPETLDTFLENPRGVFPGTRMAYRGQRDAGVRADIIAYLTTFSAVAAEEAAGLSPEAEAIIGTEGDLAYGEYLASECTACHKSGADQGIPAIAGMPREAFVPAMLEYRGGTRTHQVMNMVTERLGDEEIAALAAFFEAAE